MHANELGDVSSQQREERQPSPPRGSGHMSQVNPQQLKLRLHWDRHISRELGAEVKSARDKLGWSRKTTASQLRPTFNDKTVLGIEDGSRHLTVPQHIEVCQLLRVDPARVLSKVLYQLGDFDGFTAFTLHLTLVDIANDNTPDFAAAQSWARRRLAAYPVDTHVLIDGNSIKELAASFGYPFLALTNYLCRFTTKPNARIP